MCDIASRSIKVIKCPRCPDDEEFFLLSSATDLLPTVLKQKCYYSSLSLGTESMLMEVFVVDVYRKIEFYTDMPVSYELVGVCDKSTENTVIDIIKNCLQLCLQQGEVTIQDCTTKNRLWSPHKILHPLHYNKEENVICETSELNLARDSSKNSVECSCFKSVSCSSVPRMCYSHHILLKKNEKSVIIGRFFEVNDKYLAGFQIDIGILCMEFFGIKDWRLMWTKDTDFVKQFSCFQKLLMNELFSTATRSDKNVQVGHLLHKFSSPQPVYLYAPTFRHNISFWEPKNYSEYEFFSMFYDTTSLIVKDIYLKETYFCPTSNRKSLCYTVIYQSCDYPISHEMAAHLQSTVRRRLINELQYELRPNY